MQNRSITTPASNPGRTRGRRRVTTALLGAALAVGMLATPAAADTSQSHAHALLLHVDFASGFSYERCVDLADAEPLRKNHAHHDSVHEGVAGNALKKAGHVVVPYTCEQVKTLIG